MHFSANTFLAPFCIIFCSGADYALFCAIWEIASGTAPSGGAIWDEFSKQLKHQSIKTALNLMLNYHFFRANKVQI